MSATVVQAVLSGSGMWVATQTPDSQPGVRQSPGMSGVLSHAVLSGANVQAATPAVTTHPTLH